jgi:hypothetical protein
MTAVGSGLATTLLALTAPGPASSASAASSATITRSARVAYGTCPAHSVVVTVTVPRKPFASGEAVEYLVRLQNPNAQACGPSHGRLAVEGDEPGIFGPCGPLPLRILNDRGVAVYPPPEAILCPAHAAPQLKGHQVLTSGGSWDQFEGGGRPARVATLVPRGTYHLVIAGKVSVPLVLAPPRA